MQPSTVYEVTTLEDSILPESNGTEVPLNTSQEINQPQEEDSNPPQASPAELFYNTTRIAYRPTPIQSVEPVIGLSSEEQCRKEEDPDLTLDELLRPYQHTSSDFRWAVCKSAQSIFAVGTGGQEIS